MSSILRRRGLTDAILTCLAGTGKPVGDAEAPPNGGWSSDPNAPDSVFTPYVVAVALTASRSQGDFADSQDMWLVPYKLVCAGVSRTQADWMADKSLDAVAVLEHASFDLDGTTWKVMQVQQTTLDGTTRLDASEPPYWQRGDVVTLWLTKER